MDKDKGKQEGSQSGKQSTTVVKSNRSFYNSKNIDLSKVVSKDSSSGAAASDDSKAGGTGEGEKTTVRTGSSQEVTVKCTSTPLNTTTSPLPTKTLFLRKASLMPTEAKSAITQVIVNSM